MLHLHEAAEQGLYAKTVSPSSEQKEENSVTFSTIHTLDLSMTVGDP